jgi:hypothetical protein
MDVVRQDAIGLTEPCSIVIEPGVERPLPPPASTLPPERESGSKAARAFLQSLQAEDLCPKRRLTRLFLRPLKA